MENDNVVIVEEETSVEKPAEALSEAEIEMAKKHNISVEVDEKVEKVPAKVENKDKKPVDLPAEDFDTFEKLHDLYEKRPEMFYKLPKNIKQLYHSQKGLYKRMKDEEEKRKKFEDEFGLKRIQDSVARIKIDKIKSRLENPDGLTIEELQELLDDKREAEQSKDKPLTMKDLEDIEAKKAKATEEQTAQEREKQVAVNRKIQEVEVFANENISDLTGGKYENFDEVVSLAKEMVAEKPRYGVQIASALNSEADEREIADIIIDVARLNKKWGTPVEKTDEKAGKIVRNATRQTTSASLTGGRGSREIHISEDMDPEDAARVWDKIPRDIRHKILKKVY